MIDEPVLVTKEKVQELKNKLFGKMCNNRCNGEGNYFENGIFIECTCSKEFQWQIKLIKANISEKHWDFTFRNLLKKFLDDNELALEIVKKYCENISILTDEGVGLFIQGSYGLAKSALASYILKEGIKKDIPCFSIRMSHLTKLLIESFKEPEKADLLMWIKTKVKLLFIDEIEKDFRIGETTSFTGTHVNEFFEDIYGSKKALIVTSNLTKPKLKGIHADNVIDRLSELGDVVLVGESYRRQGNIIEHILGLGNEIQSKSK